MKKITKEIDIQISKTNKTKNFFELEYKRLSAPTKKKAYQSNILKINLSNKLIELSTSTIPNPILRYNKPYLTDM